MQTVLITLVVILLVVTVFPSTTSMTTSVNRRADGIIMNYDPYHPEMIAKYGAPGETDNEGFNPYTDSVGYGTISFSSIINR